MKKCFSVYNPAARKRGAIGIFESVLREYFAPDDTDANRQFQEEFETSGPPTTIREWKNPFDSECLFDYANNTAAIHVHIRHHVECLRRLMDNAARDYAKYNQAWHDDKDAPDSPLFQASAENQFPREFRDGAILDLVQQHLEVISENERSRSEKETSAKS